MEPVEVFPLAEYLVDEMRERGWRTSDVALRMPGEYGAAFEAAMAVGRAQQRVKAARRST